MLDIIEVLSILERIGEYFILNRLLLLEWSYFTSLSSTMLFLK